MGLPTLFKVEEGSTPSTLHGLLKARRADLLACWSDRTDRAVAATSMPHAELLDRMPAFVDEIIAALYPDAVPLPITSGNAEEHGAQRLRLGFDLAEVVHEYGLLHECILEVANGAGLTISNRDQGIVVKWLNAGIADALSQYVRQRDLELERESSRHLGFIAHELRNPLAVARLAFHRLRHAELKAGGRMVDMLERNLLRVGEMIEDTLTRSSLNMGVVPRLEPMRLGAFLRDLEGDADIEAQARRITLSVSAPEDLLVEADPQLLRSALSNLVFNALKFSHEGSNVAIDARASESQVVIEVSDACGGLPPGKAEELFQPLVQRGGDRSGFGLGLAIARQAVEAHHGTLAVRDVPGTGCVFGITLRLGAPG